MNNDRRSLIAKATADQFEDPNFLYQHVKSRSDFAATISDGRTVHQVLLDNRDRNFNPITVNALVYYEMMTQPPFVTPQP